MHITTIVPILVTVAGFVHGDILRENDMLGENDILGGKPKPNCKGSSRCKKIKEGTVLDELRTAIIKAEDGTSGETTFKYKDPVACRFVDKANNGMCAFWQGEDDSKTAGSAGDALVHIDELISIDCISCGSVPSDLTSKSDFTVNFRNGDGLKCPHKHHTALYCGGEGNDGGGGEDDDDDEKPNDDDEKPSDDEKPKSKSKGKSLGQGPTKASSSRGKATKAPSSRSKATKATSSRSKQTKAPEQEEEQAEEGSERGGEEGEDEAVR